MNRYDDGGPNLKLCSEAQQYYKEHKYATRVKAAGLLNAGEAKQLAGVDSMTVAPDLLRLLSKTEEPEVDVANFSIFDKETKTKEQEIEVKSFVHDEHGYRKAFARSYDGKGAWKTKEVCLERSIMSNPAPCSRGFSRQLKYSASIRSKQRACCAIPRQRFCGWKNVSSVMCRRDCNFAL